MNKLNILKKVFVGFALIISVFFVSCINDVDFTGNTPKQLLVLNSIVSPDSTVKVHLTKSKFFLDANKTVFSAVSDANVYISVNDSAQELMTNQGNGLYASSKVLKPYDKIKITASRATFETINAEVIIQPKIEILSIDTVHTLPLESESNWNGYSGDVYNIAHDTIIGTWTTKVIEVKVKFKDSANEKNYYKMNAYTLNSSNYKSFTGEVMSSSYVNEWGFDFSDVVFGNTSVQDEVFGDQSSNTNLFTDDLINGKEYVVTFKYQAEINTYFPGKEPADDKKASACQLVVDFQQLSKSAYLYYKTKNMSIQANGNPFTEPVQVYNNIEGGAGILGSFANSVKLFKLR